jgi:hypothetical protein
LSESRKFAIAFAGAIVAISIAGAMQWHFIGTAQNRVTAAMNSLYSAVMVPPTKSPSTPSRPPSAALAVDLAARQTQLAMARSSTISLSVLVIFCACFAVAYFSRTAWPSVIVAIYGWILGGLLLATFASQAFKQYSPPVALNSMAARWQPPPPPQTPFGLYVGLGLASALLWQGVLPWLFGWFFGSRVRSWRAFAVDFNAKNDRGAQAVPVVVERWRCQCGAANLPSAVSCYACGAIRTGPAAVATDTGQGLM